jgi:hypothetical protein
MEDLLNSSEERALRIAKLLQLISLHQNSILQHQEAKSTYLIIGQYKELLTERIAELQEIMQEVGIQIHLNVLGKAA